MNKKDLIANALTQGLEFKNKVFMPNDKIKADIIIDFLKRELLNTDFVTLKHVEGCIDDDTYCGAKELRAKYRQQINALENDLTATQLHDEIAVFYTEADKIIQSVITSFTEQLKAIEAIE